MEKRPWILLTGMISLCLLTNCRTISSNTVRLAGTEIVKESDHATSGGTIPVPERFGFGHPASESQITAWDIDISPNGTGLPSGEGTVLSGKLIYSAKCAACHGKTGVEGPYSHLVSPASGKSSSPEKAIGNYWPYATTLFDYIRRAMPYNAPGTLTDEEVYSLTAYLLQANGIIDSATVINARTLPKVVMPAQKLFVPDDRQGGSEVR